MAIESLEISILAMLTRRSTDCAMVTCFLRLINPIKKTICHQIALRTIGNLKWLQKLLAIEMLKLSILAMLAQHSTDCAMLPCV